MKNSGESAEIIAEKWKKLSVFNSISTFHHPNQIEFESCWCSTLGNYDGDKWDKLDNFSFPSENTKSLKFLIELVQSLHMNFFAGCVSFSRFLLRSYMHSHSWKQVDLSHFTFHSFRLRYYTNYLHAYLSDLHLPTKVNPKNITERRKEVGKVAKYRTRELSMCSLVVKYRGKKRISWLTKEFSCWSSAIHDLI